MNFTSPALVGAGFAVPARIRTNDDPVFDWIKANRPDHVEDFKGFYERRILDANEPLSSLMSAAARAALDDASVAPSDIDLVLGLGSVGTFISPNSLVEVHRDLQLGRDCQVIPLASEFTVFNDAVELADAVLRANGRVRNVLIVCGCDWSRHVSYHEATCIGAADGAGAVVMARSDDASRFRFADRQTATDTDYFGAMRMAGRGSGRIQPPPPFDPTLFTTPLMYFGAEAQKAFQEFGGPVPPQLVDTLLQRNRIGAAEVCLIAHQASTVLTDAWLSAINPGQYITTIREYANMTVASVPVTFSKYIKAINKEYIVFLTLGMQQQASAVLFSKL